MYLKRLEIVGFKSFTERTQVAFGPGISAVVGPNGCGKSNIIDAIRWVMGEQNPRLLRARNMEDLLFNGSQGRAAAAVAEVTLTLARELDDGRGMAEVSVTRRLYRGGDGEYLINRVPGRLKDVARFFIEAGMGTRAYAIIEQEKVGRLVDAPPEERRLLLDEAAGITRYKEQKRDSERRLESAGHNLSTLSAVTDEISKRLAAVSKAAAKAARWRDLRAELRRLELAHAGRRFLDLSSRRAALSAKADESRRSLAGREAEASAAELAIDSARLAETEASAALEAALTEWHRRQGARAEMEARLQGLAREAAESADRLGRAEAELAGVDSERGGREAEREALVGREAELSAESAKAERECDRLDEEYRLARLDGDRAQSRRQELGRKLAAARDDRQRRAERLAGLEGKTAILKDNLLKLRLEANHSKAAAEEAEKAVQGRERRRDAVAAELAELSSELGSARTGRADRRRDLDSALAALAEADRRAASLSARAQTLGDLRGQGFGWYPEGVRALMRDPEAAGIVSPVAEALRVPDGYEEAAEAFLGERLGWLLVEDGRAGLAALGLARRKGLGRLGLVSRAGLETAPGGPDLAGALLGPVDLAGDRPEVPAAGRTVLTRDGDYLGPVFMAGGGPSAPGSGADGPGQGGRPGQSGSGRKPDRQPRNRPPGGQGGPGGGGQAGGQASGGLLTRLKEAEAVAAELAEAEKALAAADAVVKAARAALSEAEEALAAGESRRSALEADLSDATGKLMVARSEAKGLAIRRDSLAGDIARVEEELSRSEAELRKEADGRREAADEVEGLESLHREAILESEEKTTALDGIRERSRQAASAADSLSERLESAKREMARISDWLKTLDVRRRSLEEQKADLAGRMARAASERAALEEAMAEVPAAVVEAEETVARLRADAAERREALAVLEDRAKGARRARDELATGLSATESELLEVNFELGRLKADLLKDWRVVLAGPKDEPEEPEVPDEPPPGDLPEEAGPEPTDGAAPEDSGQGADGYAAPASGPDSGSPPEAAPPGVQEPQEAQEPKDALKARGDQGAAAASAEPAGTAADAATPAEGDGDARFPAPAEPPPERIDPFDLAQEELPEGAEADMGRIRARLAAMGEINHTAIEEEAELKLMIGEHQRLREDLVKAIGDLKDSIERVNDTCQRRFAETFEQADLKFREIFPILFEGGEGWLSLTDEDDPLESGVEIHVHPPGKKIMVMRSLSGGEKTLTSLCLIFALYLIKPSPFCLLDEADAPLDEANIDRFNRLLRNLSEASQIIMVTHNKRTMQISDILYGVTMETPGVSRLVSVNLAEAEVLTNG